MAVRHTLPTVEYDSNKVEKRGTKLDGGCERDLTTQFANPSSAVPGRNGGEPDQLQNEALPRGDGSIFANGGPPAELAAVTVGQMPLDPRVDQL